MKVLPVRDERAMDAFVRLPWRLYKGDSNWVPPLVSAEKKMLDPARNPFWKRAEAVHFLAEKDGRPAGRLSAIVNRAHNEFHNEKTGFWGWFESENDPDVTHALFEQAAAWLREKGMDRLRGPANPSMNDPCGLLVEGFGFPPFVMMTYNPPFYANLIEAEGFTKAMDLWAFILVKSGLDREKIDRIAARIRDRGGITLRPVDFSRFREELAIVKDIYNDAWVKNWGYVPMNDEEIEFAADDMKAVMLPELAYIAEAKGRPIGFALALPDINHALRKCNGSLFPFGWWHFLKFRLRKIPTFRLVVLGIRREFHHLGIGTLFYQKFFDEGLRLGYAAAEMSWVLETNDLMIRPIKLMGGKPYKVYRMYERPL